MAPVMLLAAGDDRGPPVAELQALGIGHPDARDGEPLAEDVRLAAVIRWLRAAPLLGRPERRDPPGPAAAIVGRACGQGMGPIAMPFLLPRRGGARPSAGPKRLPGPRPGASRGLRPPGSHPMAEARVVAVRETLIRLALGRAPVRGEIAHAEPGGERLRAEPLQARRRGRPAAL